MKLLILGAAVALSASSIAFANDSNDSSASSEGSTTQTTTVTKSEETHAQKPDNSGLNERDRSDQAITAGDQKNRKSDVEITRGIRRSIAKDDQLSTYAHNVKIITKNGQVTLKGPVRSEQEKMMIEQKAQSVAGAGNVQDQMQIVRND